MMSTVFRIDAYEDLAAITKIHLDRRAEDPDYNPTNAEMASTEIQYSDSKVFYGYVFPQNIVNERLCKDPELIWI
jgi:hypothetical protein